MESDTQRLLVQQLSLTISCAYAIHLPDATTLQQTSAAEYWARQFASASQQASFVSTWIVGYQFHWTVQRAALTYVQTHNQAQFFKTVTGAMQQVQDALGEETGVVPAIFEGQQGAQGPRDEQQARWIAYLVDCCQHFANHSWEMFLALLNDGTWRKLMTWAILGLHEALSHTAPDHSGQITAAQLSASSGASELLCSWYLDARMSSEERAQAVKDAISELTTQWGYRDITVLIHQIHEGMAAVYPAEDREERSYLCVLQTPEGGPVYCRSSRRLFKELQVARGRNTPYTCCPAPDPRKHPWMVVGNLDLEDDEDAWEEVQ